MGEIKSKRCGKRFFPFFEARFAIDVRFQEKSTFKKYKTKK
jgi:hypothetical protein